MRLLRFSGVGIVAFHYIAKFLVPGSLIDSLLYCAVPLACLVVIMGAVRIHDSFAQPLLALAIGSWAIGAIVATLSEYLYVTPLIPNLFYLLFYPLAIVGLPLLIAAKRNHTLLEFVDASIFGLGLSTIGTAFCIKPVLPTFQVNLVDSYFALLYPIADLILVSVVITVVLTQGFSQRGLCLSIGVLIFTITDFLFLWQHMNANYQMGTLLDEGWLLGILLISQSFWLPGLDTHAKGEINPVLISLSVFLSALILAIIAVVPDYFPHFVLIPAISTLALAFIRMAIALRQARSIGHERILARTDELTGLPNRRRLISEIEKFLAKEGSLLLLDLDGFKVINDLYGHEMGDKVLKQVALRFNRSLPHGSLLARLGGDEFGVLLEGSKESALEVALALRGTLSYPFHIDNQEISLGVSIGVVANNGNPDLLVRADVAMYKAKREGLGVCPL
jgi:diguanylate cyclase (GGDEF)-like protein